MKYKFKFLSITYFIILSIALLIPLDFFLVTKIVEQENQPSNNTSFIIHFFLFFFLYFLFNFSFSNSIKVLLFCITYSVFIESLQLFTTRGFQIGDIIFNLIGVILSYFFVILLKNK